MVRELNVSLQNGSLLVQGDISSDFAGSKKLGAAAIGSDKILLSSSSTMAVSNASFVGSVGIDHLRNLIAGLISREWSGVAFIDTGDVGTKKLYFRGGELVFATSDVMDDRLGEVIYREAKITLEQLTKFAVMVDRRTKFGQVLVKSGDFTSLDVWKSLKIQVREIFQSLFLVDRCFIELHEDAPPPFSEISFDGLSLQLLESCYGVGAAFRKFKSRLVDDSRVLALPEKDVGTQGTFMGDLSSLSQDRPLVSELLGRSKLLKINTLFAIFKMIGVGALSIEGVGDLKVDPDVNIGSIKSVVDTYQILQRQCFDLSTNYKFGFPLEQLQEFSDTSGDKSSDQIMFDGTGALTATTVASIFEQCGASSVRIDYYCAKIRSLSRFLLQVVTDQVNPDVASRLWADYRAVAS